MAKSNLKYFSFVDLIVYVLFFFISNLVGVFFNEILISNYGLENGGKIAYIPIFLFLIFISTIYRKVRCRLTQSPCRFVGNGRYSANSVLFGIIMIVAISIVTDPLVSMFPDDIAEYVKLFTSGNMWVTLIVTVVFAPILEEVFFRGILLKDMSISWGPRTGIIISALIFAALHFNMVQAVPAFLMGLLMGYIYIYTHRGLSTVIVIHMINNLIASTSLFWGFGLDSVWGRYIPDGIWSTGIYIFAIVLLLFVLLRIFTYHDRNSKIIKKIALTDKI